MTRALIVLVLFVIVACGSSGGSTFSPTGSDGLVLKFVDGFPADEVYEGDPLPAGVTINNRGLANVAPDKLLVSWSFDPLYIQRGSAPPSTAFGSGTITDTLFGNSFETPPLPGQEPAESVKYPLREVLLGRSEYYPSGGEEYFEELDFVTNKLIGQREAPETELYALVCYEYATRLVEGVCIDVDAFMRTGREQVCKSTDLRPGTQGGPVAFTNIEVRTVPVSGALNDGGFRYARPEFIITLRNVGTGSVLAPPQEDFAAACRLEVDEKELGGLRVVGKLFDRPLSCYPEVVRLRDGEGRVQCTFSDNTVRGVTPANLITNTFLGGESGFQEAPTQNPFALTGNIMTVLTLEAYYLYRDSLSHTVTIQRSPFTDNPSFQGDVPRYKGYVYEGDTIKKNPVTDAPVTLCEEFVANPSKAPDYIEGVINYAFSCGCEKRDCSTEMMRAGYCVPALCPGSYECCDAAAYESFKKAVAIGKPGES